MNFFDNLDPFWKAIITTAMLVGGIFLLGHLFGLKDKKPDPHYTKCLELEIGKDKCNQIFNEKND